MLSQIQFDKLFNLFVNICRSHQATPVRTETESSANEIHAFYIYVDADLDSIVNMNFELAEKITSDYDLNCIKFVIVFKKN
ncbi:hypothetical protein GYW75_02250 [Gilliamella sp. ESL0232]|uniref:hypothetical protein n=1 Tax=Gilliamella sp. ESL0232 TaxID=2705037 RepID=UPI001580CDB6|nr:hypothetical protein [Gilliamella sp. ESL0232]NUE95214.1 hypothetical protein [Gilliamella sp. ESL0232]